MLASSNELWHARWVDALTFIATFVPAFTAAVAWPLVVLVIALCYRKALLERLPFLESLAWGSFRADFTKRMDLVKARAEQANLAEPAFRNTAAIEEFRTKLRWQAARNRALHTGAPGPQIVESWLMLESELRQAAERAGITIPPGTDVLGIVKLLLDRKLITPQFSGLLESMWDAYNKATQAPDAAVPIISALDYAVLAERVVATLRAISPRG